MVTLKMNETENKNMNTENSEGRKLDIFLKKINETDQSLATLTKKEWKKIPISKISSGRGYVTTDLTEVGRTGRAFCEQTCMPTLDSL